MHVLRAIGDCVNGKVQLRCDDHCPALCQSHRVGTGSVRPCRSSTHKTTVSFEVQKVGSRARADVTYCSTYGWKDPTIGQSSAARDQAQPDGPMSMLAPPAISVNARYLALSADGPLECSAVRLSVASSQRQTVCQENARRRAINPSRI